MTRYNIYYTQYNILARDYIKYIKVVYTDDIYHEVGKMICTTIEEITRIRYTKPAASEKTCEEYWLETGYEKIGDNWWRFKKQGEIKK